MTRRVRAFALCSIVVAASGCSTEASKFRHFANAKGYLEAGRSSEAIIELRNAIALDDKWGQARLQLADAYAATGQPELAYHEYIRAADLLPTDSEAQMKAATYLLLAKQFEDASVRARRVLEIDESNIDARILLANALAEMRDTDGALAQINVAIAADPSRSASYAALAHVYLLQGHTHEALQAYLAGVREAPQSVPARLALGGYQWSTGDRENALRTLETAYGIDSANITVNRTLATMYAALGRSADAERHLQLVARASSDEADDLRLVDFYLANRRLADARRALPAVTQKSAATETRVARIEYLEGRVDAANERVKRVLANEPNYVSTLLLKSEQSLRAGRYDDAIWEAGAALDVQPRSTAPYFIRAEAELRLGRTDAALRSYTTIVQLDPKAVDAIVALSRLHLANDSVDSAVLFAHEAVNLSAQHVGARLALVRAYLARGDDSLAAQELNQLPASSRTSSEAAVLEGMLHARGGRTRDARGAFERALKIDPTALEPLRALTSMDAARGDFVTSARRIDAALAVNRDDPALLLLSAKIAFARGDLRAAERAVREVIDRDPLNITAVAVLGRIFAIEGRLAAAIDEFDARAARSPADIGARLIAAVATHSRGHIPDAERRYRDVLRLEPRAALAANNLAAIYLERDVNLYEAEQLATAAAEQAPDNPEVLDTLASLYSRRKLYGRAIKLQGRAVALEPQNATFQYHLGLSYAQSGDPDRAREALRTAVRLDRKLSAAQQALVSLEQ